MYVCLFECRLLPHQAPFKDTRHKGKFPVSQQGASLTDGDPGVAGVGLKSGLGLCSSCREAACWQRDSTASRAKPSEPLCIGKPMVMAPVDRGGLSSAILS